MDNALRVRGIEGVGDLNADLQCVINLNAAAADALLQVLAFEQLHHQERLALILFNLVDGADIRMVQQRGGAGLALKTLQRALVAVELLGQKLGGDVAAQVDVLRLVDDAHAARAQLLENAIVGDRPANHSNASITGRAAILGRSWGNCNLNLEHAAGGRKYATPRKIPTLRQKRPKVWGNLQTS